uniref:Bestrophin homolog n=2 Tax=Acrobeloides nanus TaxID=290746 RepID=A0A914CDF7_9BILA
MDSVVMAGFLMPHEKEILCQHSLHFERYWIPLNWALRTVYKRFEDGKIAKPSYVNAIYAAVNDFQKRLQTLCNFDWVPIPLAYPQIVFLAIRIFMLLCLVSRQPLIHSKEGEEIIPDIVLPFMTILQIFFFLGWTKVAEQLLNPLGKDDDDLETNWIIDRNITLAMLLAENYNKNPIQVLENEDFTKSQLDITQRAKYLSHPYKGSVAEINFEASTKVNMFSTSIKQKMSRIRKNKVKPSTNGIPLKTLVKSKRHRSHSYPPIYDRRSHDPPLDIKTTLAHQYTINPPVQDDKNYPRHSEEFYTDNIFAASYAYHPRKYGRIESFDSERTPRKSSDTRTLSLESLLSEPNTKHSNESFDTSHDSHLFTASDMYYPRRIDTSKHLASIAEEKQTPTEKPSLSKYPTFESTHRVRKLSRDSIDSHDSNHFADSGYKLGPLEIVEEEDDEDEEESEFSKAMRK